jgi:hypothetical protein
VAVQHKYKRADAQGPDLNFFKMGKSLEPVNGRQNPMGLGPKETPRNIARPSVAGPLFRAKRNDSLVAFFLIVCAMLSQNCVKFVTA